MPFIDFNGTRRYKPGTYSKTEVVSNLAGPLPDFLVPVIIGSGHDGHGYDARAKSLANETEFDWYRLCTSAEAVGAYFGYGSDLHKAATFAFRHGLPRAYVCALNPMTRASVLVDDGSTEQFTLYPRTFGPAGGWIKVAWNGTTNVFSYTRVKRYAMLASDLGSSATRAYVKGTDATTSWLTPGATVIVGSNSVAGASRTITNAGVEIGSTGQKSYWVELSSSIGSACNTSAYAMILQYEDAAVTITGLASCQAIIDALNGTATSAANEDLVAVKHANFTNADPADISSAKAIKEVSEWNTATAGTAPATVDSDATSWVTLMDGGARERFDTTEGVVAYAFLLADSDDTRHGTFRDYAITRAASDDMNQIAIVTGVGWGDKVPGAGDTTAPDYRAATLNSQYISLCAGGLDREAACLSMAPAVFGRWVSGGLPHNLTNDPLIFSHLEVNWTPTQLNTLLRKGVITYALTYGDTIRYQVAQGLNTLQANATAWNASDSTTPFVMQRDLAEFVNRAIRATLNENQIGADRVDPSTITTRVLRKAAQLDSAGVLKKSGFAIVSVDLNATGNGYDVQWSIRLPDTVDYITVTTRVLVG